MAGTPLYMAPEMLGDAVSTHTDVYLLGGLLYQIIAHRPPHEGSSLEEVVSSIYKNELSFPPSAPPGLQEICRVAMAFDPEERYESANAMGQALRDYRQHRSSLQLSLQAQANLHTLKKLAKEGSSRERMQALLGEIRFAFQSAIEVWSENTNAHTGLHDAIETVARVELEKGDPRAAASILAELQTPTPELLRDVERALSQLTKEGARLAELGHQHDANLGRRARVVILGLLASVSIAGYLWLQLSGNVSRLIDHQVMLIGSLVIMIAFGGLLYWSRESLAQTLINRYFAAGMMTLFVAQALLSAVANLIGLAPEQTQVLWGLIWFVLSSFMAMALPVKIWPLAVVTGLCFVAAAMWIEFRLYAMSVVGVALIANAAAIWWPDQEDQESRGE